MVASPVPGRAVGARRLVRGQVHGLRPRCAVQNAATWTRQYNRATPIGVVGCVSRSRALAVIAAAMSLLAAGCGSRVPAGTAAGTAAPPRTALSPAATPARPGTPGPSSPASARNPGRSPAPRCGASSESFPPGDRHELTGVQFVSGSTGWVAGWDQILGTDDGGRHWVTEYRTTAAAALATVDFADGTHGWVVGASTILVTVDGGGHWRALPEPCPVIRTVHFISPAVGFAVAGGSLPWLGVPPVGGVLLRTTDGGRHWQRLAAPANAQTVCFADPERGWLGADGRIYGTVDGGQSWTLAVRGAYGAPDAPSLAEVECAGSAAAWAEVIGPGATMSQQPHIGYHTFGAAWTPIFAEQYFPHPGVFVPANSPGAESGPFSPVSPAKAVFIDSCPACSPAGTPPPGTALQGTAPMDLAQDGGAVLAPRGRVRGLTVANAAAFVTLDNGWVVGTQITYHTSSSATTSTLINRIVHTWDGGRTWQVQYTLAP